MLGETGLRVEPALRSTVSGTCVGLVEALRQAQDWLERGVCDRCIVGAVDSLVDTTVLAPLDLLGLLKTVARPVGMLPGEAAAFHVLGRVPSGAQPPAATHVRVGVPVTATGIGPSPPAPATRQPRGNTGDGDLPDRRGDVRRSLRWRLGAEPQR